MVVGLDHQLLLGCSFRFLYLGSVGWGLLSTGNMRLACEVFGLRGTTTIRGSWLEQREGCRCCIPCSFSHKLALGVPETLVVVESVVAGGDVVVRPSPMLEVVLDVTG